MRRSIRQGMNKLIAVSFGLSAVYGPVSVADDTEVFTAYTPIDTSANVVFIIDTSGSMGNAPANANSSTAKIQIVKDVFEKLIFDPNNPSDHSTLNPSTAGMNVAIMRFDNRSSSENRGGYFISAMKELNDANKTSIWDSVNNLAANGSTPLAETLYEASLFFDGANPKFGNATLPGTNVSDVLVSADGPYLSPFQSQDVSEQCAINNHIVLLTDGQPTHDGDADVEINGLIEGGNCSFSTTGSVEEGNLVITDCLPEVAKYLHGKDFLPDDSDKDPNVRTHTIAFDLQVTAAVDLLNQTANNGGGLATSATDAMELAEAISRILSSIDDTAKTFVSPSVSLSSTYRLQHEDAMYYALFKPETSAQWTGNLKGYQLGSDGVLLDYSTPPEAAIVTEPPPMKFSDSARSKWSPSIDGNDLAAGGVASKLPASRTIYTHDGSDLLEFSDSTVSHTDLGVTTAEKADLIQWAKGLDAGGEIRPNPIGDPLHSTPIVVDYGASGGKIIFFGTNQGFLHAIDADTGEEVFAFIPKELLGNLKTFQANTAGVHPYGLDGPITAFVDDADQDGIIEGPDETYKVYLYFGMRRGGNQYYALDVSNVNTPSFLWQINPDAENSVFSQMGQSWSKPIVTKIKSGNRDETPTVHDVLLFAGGYDPDYDPQLPDTPHPTVSNAAGAAIYAVGAVDGELKWIASADTPPSGLTLPGVQVNEMVNSIPSDLAILDLDGTLDHVADRIYAADILGNVFRFDLNAVDNSANYTPTGKLLANLSGDNRRFYHSPEAVLTRNGLRQYVSINIGSGYRAHPLYVSGSSIKDRFYSIRDDHIFTALPDGYTAFDQDSLVSVSAINDSTVINKGWYYELTQGTGEKVLAKSTTTNNSVIFTTYSPPTAPNTPSCSPPAGEGRYYQVNLLTPRVIANDIHVLESSGIPPAPSVIINGGGTVDDPNNPGQSIPNSTPRVQLCVGVECETLNTAVILDRTFWQQLR